MKQYQGIDADAQYLVNLMFAPLYTRICYAALELEVFTCLESPQTAAELAGANGWDAKNTGFFCDALTGIGLLYKENGVYRNTSGSDKYLVKGDEYYLGDMMPVYVGGSGYDHTDLTALVREGPQAALEEVVSNVSFADQMDSMRKAQMGARGKEIVTILETLPEYEPANVLLDLGGGTGMLGIAAVQAKPGLQAVIYDVPAMAAGINESIRIGDVQDLVTVKSGDYLTDDIGNGYDIILAVGTLNFAMPVLDQVMNKLLAALGPGGVLVVSGDSIHDDGTMPGDMLAGWLPFTLKGMDFRMPQGLIPQAALQAGFRNVHTITVPSYTGTTEINLLRK